MKLKGALSGLSSSGKAMILIGLCLFFYGAGSVLSYFLCKAVFHINLLEENLVSHIQHNQNVINSYKILNALAAGGMFIIGPLAYSFLTSGNILHYFRLNKVPGIRGITSFLMVMMFVTPVINYLVYLNSEMQLPPFLEGVESWMRMMEDEAKVYTDAFLSTKSVNGLLFNIVVIAMIPAIGEELLFRGLIQQTLTRKFNNYHVGVILSAALFSAIHMQFYGFIPRMVLGILLGYAFAWSGSLWLSIAGHFFNNAAALIMAFYANRNNLPFNQDTIGTDPGDLTLLITSLLITGAGLSYLYRFRVQSEKESHLSE